MISWQAEFVVCVCACGAEPLSLVKTNGKINTWLTQVPRGKMMARMFTYKLHPAGTATFPAEGLSFCRTMWKSAELTLFATWISIVDRGNRLTLFVQGG